MDEVVDAFQLVMDETGMVEATRSVVVEAVRMVVVEETRTVVAVQMDCFEPEYELGSFQKAKLRLHSEQ